MNDAQHPYTAIMGGSKVSTKIDIIKKSARKSRQPDSWQAG